MIMRNQQIKRNLFPRRELRILVVFLIVTAYLSAEVKPRRVASIPFELVGTYVVVTVRINDSSPLRLILDSGIRNTIITELQETDQITLTYSSVKDLIGLGSGQSLEAYASDYNTMRFGKIKMTNKTVYVLQKDIFNLSKHTGTKINGLMGVDFFYDYTVEIDYNAQRIRFYEPTPFDTPKGYGVLPILVESSKFFINLSVLNADSSRQQAKMLIDTGAELNAWFQSITKESVHLPAKWILGTIGEGLNGLITGKFGRVPQICIGEFCLNNPIVSFPDSASIVGIFDNSKRDGTIGSQLLSRFNTIFDFNQKKFYFKPNDYFRNKFQYNVAGIEVTKVSSFLPITEVLAVWENSPAAKAGVKPGDIILEIDGNKTLGMSINEIKYMFERPRRRQMKILFKREDTETEVTIDMIDKL
jgi:hypothetical protein